MHKLITAGLDNAAAVAEHEGRCAEWLAGYRSGLIGLRMALDAFPAPEQTQPLDRLLFAATWARLAKTNLDAYQRQTGQKVPDSQIVGYVSAGMGEGLYLLAGDVRLLAEAHIASELASFSGPLATSAEEFWIAALARAYSAIVEAGS